MQNESNDGADAIRQPQCRKATFAETTILRELEQINRKSAELEESLQRVRVRVESLEDGTWSPVRLHVMFRQYGTTFAALSRAIQGAMCPGTKVAYIAWNHASVKLCYERALQMLKAYYGEAGFKNIKVGEHQHFGINFKLPNGSTVEFLSRSLNDYERYMNGEYDRVIVDSVILKPKMDAPHILNAEADGTLSCNVYALDSLINPIIASKDPQVDIYLQHEVQTDEFEADGTKVVNPQLASPEYIKELLESRKDFGEGVKKGVIRWDLNRI